LLAYTCFAATRHPLTNLVRAANKLDLSKNPLPKLFIIGEQKCGTSSLFSTLSDHLEVCENRLLDGDRSLKELEFFDSDASVPELLREFPRYLQHFSQCPATQLRMDATPQYLSRNMTAQNIQEIYQSLGQDLSELRFIIMVREPVNRVLSYYRHRVRKHGWFNESLSEYVKERMDKYNDWLQTSSPGEFYTSKSSGIVKRGLYANSIGYWFTKFDPSQFMILSLKQLLTDTPKVMDAVHNFIGVSPRRAEMHAANVHHDSNTMEAPVPEGLEEFYEPHIKALFELKNKYPGSFYDVPENPFSLEI